MTCPNCMSQPGPEDVVRLTTLSETSSRSLLWHCVGCGENHSTRVYGDALGPRWAWNGSCSKPTLAPSVRVGLGEGLCHSFVRDGVVHFLDDCTHELAGQEVAMLPENARR